MAPACDVDYIIYCPDVYILQIYIDPSGGTSWVCVKPRTNRRIIHQTKELQISQ